MFTVQWFRFGGSVAHTLMRRYKPLSSKNILCGVKVNKRWGINIDIEGFSNLYESGEESQTRAILGLRELMNAIIQIGQQAFPGDPALNVGDRLFAHQFGDGFIIVSEYEETDASRAIAIATALMRHMLVKGYATKSAISVGSMTDISGCYPEAMREAENNALPLGSGLLTSIPVMGTALTKAHKLSSKASGGILVVDRSAFDTIPKELIENEDNNLIFINWMLDRNEMAKGIAASAGLEFSSNSDLEASFQCYIKQPPQPPSHWVEGSRKSIVLSGL
ncbi:hypothetical protein AB6D65_22950 [Vibrio alginolyticus]|uniref:hypothetical protein n=1 Tax=Vibrio TaxID=662 RepID=UPI0021CE0EA3|nr:MULTISPECIES: hypothetical protein [unclassified Vibrio]MDW1665770.1 hypothetical protein [Vibrio sp. Vb2656]MDW1703247.1 hypothetical protein [Vibrio sp. Vb2657]